MFTRLTIEALKGVGDVELRFEPGLRVFTLFGPNGVGKTKCLEAIFQFLLLGNRMFLDEQDKQGMHRDFAVMARATDGDGHVFQVPLHKALRPSGVWQDGSPGFHDLPVVFLGAVSRSNVTAFSPASNLLGSAADRRSRLFNAMFAALRDGDLRTLGMDADVQSWFVVRAQSVNPYQKQDDNRQVEITTVLEMLHVLDERIDPAFLQVDGSGRVSLQVEGQVRLLSELSSGFTSILKIVQAIVAGYGAFTNEANLRQVRGVVLVDEIESHLHAQWQSTIIPRLKELLPNTTFFVATHSPLVLAQLEEGEAYLLRRDPDGVVRTQVIDSPSRRAFADVLESAFGVDLNAMKRDAMERVDQSAAKQRLLDLLAGKGRP